MPLLALLPLGLAPVLEARAAGIDDRQALQRFVATGAVSNRRLQLDLAAARWSPQELRAAVARSYGLRTTAVAAFLDSAAGRSLLSRQLLWWSPELSPQVRLAALRSAIVADSQDGSLSLLGVVERLPVAFVLAEGAGSMPSGCGCPEACGRSALAHLAFLIACVQAGATAPAPAP